MLHRSTSSKQPASVRVARHSDGVEGLVNAARLHTSNLATGGTGASPKRWTPGGAPVSTSCRESSHGAIACSVPDHLSPSEQVLYTSS